MSARCLVTRCFKCKQRCHQIITPMFLSYQNHPVYNLFILNICHVLVNKFVLSTLQFTIPTVFQGWQTLVCVVLLSILMKWKKLNSDIQWLDKHTLFRLSFPLICFSVANVAGSKALAVLPVPIFLCGNNVVPASVVLLTKAKNTSFGYIQLSCCIIWISVIIIFISTFQTLEGWFWLSTSVTAGIMQTVAFNHLHVTSVNPITLIYYRNFSSVMFLLPLSIYLEEAASALRHPHIADTEFFIGCLLSGIFCTGVQLLAAQMDNDNILQVCLGGSRLAASVVALLFFTAHLKSFCWFFVVVNLVTGAIMFIQMDDETDDAQEKSEIDV